MSHGSPLTDENDLTAEAQRAQRPRSGVPLRSLRLCGEFHRPAFSREVSMKKSLVLCAFVVGLAQFTPYRRNEP